MGPSSPLTLNQEGSSRGRADIKLDPPAKFIGLLKRKSIGVCFR